MRTLLMAGLIAVSGAALAQYQQQGQAPQQQTAPQDQTRPQDEKIKERVRVDGAAGGTAPLPEEKRKGVGAGAGPHRHKNPPPVRLPHDQPIEPPK